MLLLSVRAISCWQLRREEVKASDSREAHASMHSSQLWLFGLPARLFASIVLYFMTLYWRIYVGIPLHTVRCNFA